jgi:hypothetical protein
MIEPIEAEFAQPPIFTNKQERRIDDETVEVPGGITGTESDDNTRAGSPENEKLKGKILVDFEPGTREDPREWNLTRKW